MHFSSHLASLLASHLSSHHASYLASHLATHHASYLASHLDSFSAPQSASYLATRLASHLAAHLYLKSPTRAQNIALFTVNCLGSGTLTIKIKALHLMPQFDN